MTAARQVALGLLLTSAALVPAAGAAGLAPPDASPGKHREFVLEELRVSSSHEPLATLLGQLPNRAAWERWDERRRAAGLAALQAHVDPRSGAATSVLLALPLLPGRGLGNHVTLADVERRVGRSLARVDRAVVAQLVRGFVQQHADALGLDLAQLGPLTAEPVDDERWQVSAGQQVQGVRVRDALLAATVSQGNLVLVGTQGFARVTRGTRPRLSAEHALASAFAAFGGRSVSDELPREPRLELVPVAPPEHQRGEAFVGPVGSGYAHRLAWSVLLRRAPERGAWEALVDADDGQVLALQPADPALLGGQPSHEIVGGVYPLTNTGICPTPYTCGVMQTGWPMPFADTGLAAPNDFTATGGVFTHPPGTATTTLTGRFVEVDDMCGALSQSSARGIDLLGSDGQHDCTTPDGASDGNTAASRTAFYELNKLSELARGWLPLNAWLQTPLVAVVNHPLSCGALYSVSSGSLLFYRSGGGCRNTGELAGVFDHEWGHAMDDNDTGGVLSNSTEAYGDIAAIYRLQSSCIGYGFLEPTTPNSCGLTADGSGRNATESQTGPAHCDLDCSGVRDADWDKHADHLPDTALGFACSSCGSGTGPCGRQTHCSAAPARQAAWDLAARDLRAAPFHYSQQQAFILANRLFYQGSGNVGLWHACTCGSSSSGCGATNAYMQWLAADDDNGNLADGTPHMTALHAAFDRHGLACATPAPVNSGCAGGPVEHPPLWAVPQSGAITLQWDPVPNAVRYYVFRSEGQAGCLYGKARIADVLGQSHTDSGLLPGRTYSYNVVAVGASSACNGRLSRCVQASPLP